MHIRDGGDKSKTRMMIILFNLLYSSHQTPFKFPVQITNNQTGSYTWGFETKKNVSCVALKQCPTFSWLMNFKNIQNDIIQIDPGKIIDFLKRKRCSIGELYLNKTISLETKVACPSTMDVLTDDSDGIMAHIDGDEENVKDYVDCPLNVRLEPENVECSLEVSLGPEQDPLSDLHTIRLSGADTTFCILPSLSKNKILHLTAQGSCCWKLYSAANLEGEYQKVEPGDSLYPQFQPKSAKIICC